MPQNLTKACSLDSCLQYVINIFDDCSICIDILSQEKMASYLPGQKLGTYTKSKGSRPGGEGNGKDRHLIMLGMVALLQNCLWEKFNDQLQGKTMHR